MATRKTRSDIQVGNLEKKLGLAKGAIRNPDGTDARSDKKLGTLRAEYKKYQRMFDGPPVRAGSTSLPKKATATKATKASAPKAAAPKKATPKKAAPASKPTSRKK